MARRGSPRGTANLERERFGAIELLEIGDQLVEERGRARVVAHPATQREAMPEAACEREHLEGAGVPELLDLPRDRGVEMIEVPLHVRRAEQDPINREAGRSDGRR